MQSWTTPMRLLVSLGVLSGLLTLSGALRAADKPSKAKTGVSKATFAKIAEAVKEKTIKETDYVGAGGDIPFRSVVRSGSVLVGFELTYTEHWGEKIIKSVRPLYLTASSPKTPVKGAKYGWPSVQVQQVKAKPGYAVGAITAKGDIFSGGICGFSITYMKINGDELDPDDSYESDWVGGKGKNKKAVKLGGTGALVVGVFGKLSQQALKPVTYTDLKGMGLVTMPEKEE
jgi:hypothetical protein